MCKSVGLTERRRDNGKQPAQAAFTRTELLVVISVIFLLAALLFPAIASSRADSAAAKCMSNHRQIATAWQMYASMNRDFFPPNGTGTGVLDSPAAPNWCEGWEDFTPDSPDNTNWHQLVDTQAPFGSPASLGPYVGRSPQAYKCPDDIMMCREGAGFYPRVRSIAMNGFVEGGAYGTLGESSWYPTWRAYNKVSDLGRPSPANLLLTMDMHPNSINSACFIEDVINNSIWEALPASYHNGAAGISFADGHSELHHWQRAATRQSVRYIYINGNITDTPGNVDASWMTNHVSDTITGG